MSESPVNSLAGYQAALTGAAYFPIPEASYLRVSGPDRVAFLQRQTTNDARQLSSQRAMLSVLTSPTARILDVFYLLEEPNGDLGLVGLPGRAAATFRFLKSKIFYMDKVSVSDASNGLAQVALAGPQASQALALLGMDTPSAPGEVGDFPVTGGRAIGEEPAFGLGFRLLTPMETLPAVEAALEQAGAARLEAESFHLLKVEAGQPQAGFELVEDYTPLETGLRAAISDHKGCYTGQEIIARQITYDKVTQTLRGLRLPLPAAAGERVWAEGRPAGTVTSAAVSPRFGPIALAVVKRPHDQPGTEVAVGREAAQAVKAVVAELPFR